MLFTRNSFTTLQLNDKGEAVAVGKLFQEKITSNPPLLQENIVVNLCL